MIDIDYSPYPNKRSDKLSKELIDIIEKHDKYFLDNLNGGVSIVTVESPFILADNGFDLGEANNEMLEINVTRTKVVGFTGGNFYAVYEKKPNTPYSYIIHGNEEEGFNIFNLI